MSRNGHGLKHMQNKKKSSKKKSSKKKIKESSFKMFMDRAIYFVGVSAPLMTIPQAFKVYMEKDASSLSVATWISYIIISTMWIIYGIQHKEKPIIATNVAWLIIDVAIVIAIFIY